MTQKLTKLLAILTGSETKESAKHRSDLHKAVQGIEQETEKFVKEGERRRSERKREEAVHVQG